jgi:hypothetical protein
MCAAGASGERRLVVGTGPNFRAFPARQPEDPAMKLAALLVAIVLGVPAAPALAADATPVHVRGTIEKLDGSTLMVKSREGDSLAITLPADVKINAVAPASAADIKAGDFIGTAALPGADGKLHAQEVLIFPEALRGVGEGHRPWDLTPDSTMTNATVAEVAAMAGSGVLKLTYKGGEKELAVGSDAAVVTLVPGDMSLLKPGAAVFVPAEKQADGSLTAGFVLAEKNGVKPPM